jgi:hypothetical protein
MRRELQRLDKDWEMDKKEELEELRTKGNWRIEEAELTILAMLDDEDNVRRSDACSFTNIMN